MTLAGPSRKDGDDRSEVLGATEVVEVWRLRKDMSTQGYVDAPFWLWGGVDRSRLRVERPPAVGVPKHDPAQDLMKSRVLDGLFR